MCHRSPPLYPWAAPKKPILNRVKRIINWNKYQSKVTIRIWNENLGYLIDSSFKGVHKLSVLSFGNNAQETSYKPIYSSKYGSKRLQCNIDGQNFCDQPVKSD